MGGNVGEWTLDWEAIDASTMPPTIIYIDPCVDCARLDPDSRDPMPGRDVRGGQFDAISVYIRIAHVLFQASFPEMAFDDLGFRCARPAM